MPRYVAFLRAINVGGHVVKMDRLRSIVEAEGVTRVSTFIASGNVLFEAASRNAPVLERTLEAAFKRVLGYEVATFIRTADELISIAEHRAYKVAELRGAALYIGFMRDRPNASEKKLLTTLETPVDTLRVHDRELYWKTGSRFSDAQFSPSKMEKLLGKPATFRNVTTVTRMAALVDGGG